MKEVRKLSGEEKLNKEKMLSDDRLKDLSTVELLMARQWLATMQGVVGLASANKSNRLLFSRMKDVDTELWFRIVSEEQDPPWKKSGRS